MSRTIVLDLETIPDFELLRSAIDWTYVEEKPQTDDAVLELFVEQRAAAGKSVFPPPPYHQIVFCGLVERSKFGLTSESRLNAGMMNEGDILQDIVGRFDEGEEPKLVTYNGKGFDMGVIVARAMKHKVSLGKLAWQGGPGRGGQDYKWNNYLNRFHDRHLDLMDVLALYNGGGKIPMDVMCNLIGVPGKMGTSGGDVLEMWRAGKWLEIGVYGIDDCWSTYAIFLHYLLTFGKIDQIQHQQEFALLLESCSTAWRQKYEETRKT